jgi:hypothetical protein
MPFGGLLTVGLISAGTAVAGGIMGSRAAGKAAQTQSDAATTAAQAQLAASREANALTGNMYEQNRADLAPWRNAGAGALRQLNYLLGIPGVTTHGGSTRAGSVDPGQFFGTPLANETREQIIARLNQPGQIGSMVPGIAERLADTILSQREMAANDQAAQGGNALEFSPEITTAGDPNTEMGAYGSLMHDFSNEDFVKDPGYEFRLSEGQKAIERSAAARGNLLSGRAVKEATRYGSDYASSEFGNAFSRFKSNQADRFNRLASIAGVGQQATETTGQMGTNAAGTMGGNLVAGQTNASNALMAGANARASGYVGGANAWSDAMSGAAGSFSNALLMNKMFPQAAKVKGPSYAETASLPMSGAPNYLALTPGYQDVYGVQR